MEPKTPTLDQISVFLAVVEAGSFAGAARRLGRATSVISYAIANLENQLGVTLFARAGTARPKLTDAGRTFLERARTLLEDVERACASTKRTARGEQGRVVVGFTSSAPFHPFIPRERKVKQATPKPIYYSEGVPLVYRRQPVWAAVRLPARTSFGGDK